ncbi:hypothetical protein SAMN05216522_102228 [Rosenbergiella nectarea]|uniref:Uncharacterized protein n=1 Tax=Rosenbergiella nectarea TaxID=988801 RepID=A0A1H9F9W3_9GAMM|nr:hypothetical protein [Rosenbergiella nectarea]SEQ34724.1 hypothetical protein SAMN05216522_102228 [Rosenbergiella nectarea]
MSIHKLIIGVAIISLLIIIHIYDKKTSPIFKKLDNDHYKRFRKYPNFYWLENYPRKYWSRIRLGVYGRLLKIETYDANDRWLKTISKEEFDFIKKILIATQKFIIKHFLFKTYFLYIFFIFIITLFLVDGGLDYLLEPVTHENIMQGISLL